MNGNDFIGLLGLTSDDDQIKALLGSCGITVKPKIEEPDDETAIVENKTLGLEITFDDERYLAVKSREYEEGALVLSNVRMYGEGNDTFRSFKGNLPYGLLFGSNRQTAEATLGAKPAWVKRDGTYARWDFKTHCEFLGFGESDTLGEVDVQLPVKK